MKYRWIMYSHQNIPGNVLSDLGRVTSLSEAKDAFKDYCNAVFTNDCSATLYPYNDEDWDEAVEFKDYGCPFDYPTYFIVRGPLDGIIFERA